MMSLSQLKDEYNLTSMRLLAVEDEIKQKMAEGEKLFQEKSRLKKLIVWKQE